jgi:hypothetical protein
VFAAVAAAVDAAHVSAFALQARGRACMYFMRVSASSPVPASSPLVLLLHPAVDMLQLLRPGYPAADMLVEIPANCSIAEARTSIMQHLQQELPNEPQAVVLLWCNENAAGGPLVTAADDDERVDARELDSSHRRFKGKTLLVCWLPKVTCWHMGGGWV